MGERDGQEAELHAWAAIRPRRNEPHLADEHLGPLDRQVVAAVLDGHASGDVRQRRLDLVAGRRRHDAVTVARR